MKTELCHLMTSNGSDKGGNWHNYTEIYSVLFGHLRDKQLNIFELGIGTSNPDMPCNMGENGVTGASLKAWAEYFPLANMYGADIDRGALFQSDRIKTFYCDQQSDKEIIAMWKNKAFNKVQFDIIIDDGLHEHNANMTFLKNSLHKLKDDGLYIIEDITNYAKHLYVESLDEMSKSLSFVYYIVCMPSDKNQYDNNIAIIRRTKPDAQ